MGRPTEGEGSTTVSREPRAGGDGPCLVVSLPTGTRILDVPREAETTLGRSPSSGIVLDDDSVSRTHARLRNDGELTIEDCGSRNGTVVSGRTLEPGERAPLEVGSVVEVGAVTIVLQRSRPAMPIGGPESTKSRDGIVLADPMMTRLYELLDLIAPSPLNVLVYGETGTGKEVFASEIHARSTRAKKPLLSVNCATLSGPLLESELFGHERGAFTGAVQARAGLFEAADGGTLFLDEIGELPIDTQAKLLRAVELGEVIRLGSTQAKRVDVRIVGATHRDLRRLAREERFRADLLHRLNGFNVTLPPLRKRRTEIEPLAKRFVAAAAKATGVAPPSIEREVLDALLAHTWPGNIRELRNVMDRAVALVGRGNAIGKAHLMIDEADPPASRVFGASAPAAGASLSPAAGTVPPPQGLGPLRSQVDDFERARVEEALRATNGNQKEAAKLLGVSRRTLVTKISQLGIGRPRKG
ncbi:MAG: sigma 54-interacting transcriptional regulator [Deltaproteobacteria bacterium]|nr:sigma 54-interacting transcriptional regulator [Deltaproteobacteria bacterium]